MDHDYVGVRVWCVVCGCTKKPHGRSAPPGAIYCNDDCRGYKEAPRVGCLWPDETCAGFGYEHCHAGARRDDDGTDASVEDAIDEVVDRVLGDDGHKEVLNFPTAWAIQREVGPSLRHDPHCSSVPGWDPLSGPGLLCDCGAILKEYLRRVRIQR